MARLTRYAPTVPCANIKAHCDMRNILMLEKHDVFFWHSSCSVSGVLPSANILWCGLQQAEIQARTESDHWGRLQMDPQQDVLGSINIASGSGPRSNWIVWNESWASLVLSPQKLRTRVWSSALNGPKEPTEDYGSLLITMDITDTRKLRFGLTWDGYREESLPVCVEGSVHAYPHLHQSLHQMMTSLSFPFLLALFISSSQWHNLYT